MLASAAHILKLEGYRSLSVVPCLPFNPTQISVNSWLFLWQGMNSSSSITFLATEWQNNRDIFQEASQLVASSLWGTICQTWFWRRQKPLLDLSADNWGVCGGDLQKIVSSSEPRFLLMRREGVLVIWFIKILTTVSFPDYTDLSLNNIFSPKKQWSIYHVWDILLYHYTPI